MGQRPVDATAESVLQPNPTPQPCVKLCWGAGCRSARAYPLAAIMEDCRDYFQRSGRRVTFEYTLMDGVNASTQHVTPPPPQTPLFSPAHQNSCNGPWPSDVIQRLLLPHDLAGVIRASRFFQLLSFINRPILTDEFTAFLPLAAQQVLDLVA